MKVEGFVTVGKGWRVHDDKPGEEPPMARTVLLATIFLGVFTGVFGRPFEIQHHNVFDSLVFHEFQAAACSVVDLFAISGVVFFVVVFFAIFISPQPLSFLFLCGTQKIDDGFLLVFFAAAFH